MAEGKGQIEVASSVSWLLENLQMKAEERLEFLKEGIAEGVPREEYEQMVGRYKEAKRWKEFMFADTFAEFQAAEESVLEDDGLEEMPDDDE